MTEGGVESIPLNLEVSSLGKRVGSAELISKISFGVGNDGCFGIIGENGAGKTTLLRIITALVAPTSGEIKIRGVSPHKNRATALSNVTGFVGIPAFYSYMTAYSNLSITADFSHYPSREQIFDALEKVGLADEAYKKVGQFSRGMLQRLGIGLALLNDKPIIIMDEPTQGLDEAWVGNITKLFKEMKKNGKTFIITSHNFDFIVELCDKVLMLERGKKVYMGSLSDLLEFPYYFFLNCSPAEKVLDLISEMEFVHGSVKMDGGIKLNLEKDYANQLVKTLVENGCKIFEFSLKKYSVMDLISESRSKILEFGK